VPGRLFSRRIGFDPLSAERTLYLLRQRREIVKVVELKYPEGRHLRVPVYRSTEFLPLIQESEAALLYIRL
jgi:hypothetical protein